MNLMDRLVHGAIAVFGVAGMIWIVSSALAQAKANDDYQRGLTVSTIDVMFCSQISHDAGLTGKEADEATFRRLKQWQAERAAKYAKEHSR